MSPAAFVRTVVRPFSAAAAPGFFVANTARPATTASALARRFLSTSGRPTTAARTSSVPPFSSASFFAAAFRRAAARPGSQRTAYGRAGRRYQSSSAGAADAAAAGAAPGFFRRMWDSPIGIKTVHFWAPVMKWALVIAGISDFARPAEKLSVTQNVALMATGLIWTRWCLIIKPKNYLLAAANFFLGAAGVVQCIRIYLARGKTAAPEAGVAAA